MIKRLHKPNALLLILTVLLITGLGCSLAPITEADADTPQNRETVVVLHGLGRSKAAMWLLASRLEDAGYNAVRIDYDSFRTTPNLIVDAVTQDIERCCENRQHPIHFVGHSMGGLIIRAYLDRQRPENLGRVVMIGTPNHGTDFVDKYRHRWWLQIAGEAALALGTDSESFPNTLPRPDYPLGVIAGYREGSMHDDPIAGPDDGLVPVYSTLIEGMDDFILIESGHSAMRYDKNVALQTIYFLKHGQFER
ncbi:alpha/beta fold hydrolase [Candidatus Thiodiazotropha sp. LNASS1]|uniref:alpha/beta fold hydrolase n=1 Tax=Candidatus Thiodiazotropha sp. LNASS1 TaxID=3096260 RepID=UPI0034DFDBD4